MAAKRRKANSRPISSDEMPSRGHWSLSPATGSGEAAAQTQPSRQIDLDEQVPRLMQQKMEEMLTPPQVTAS